MSILGILKETVDISKVFPRTFSSVVGILRYLGVLLVDDWTGLLLRLFGDVCLLVLPIVLPINLTKITIG